jgi:hypothetical protein
MRIIFANSAALVAVALLATPILASDLEYEPEPIKRFATFAKCLAALKVQHSKDKAQDSETVTETEQTRTNVRVIVSDIDLTVKRRAAFTVQGISNTMAKRGTGVDGGTFGWGTDWYCAGRTLWKGGGHSAYISYPSAPELPTPPPAPAAPSP